MAGGAEKAHGVRLKTWLSPQPKPLPCLASWEGTAALGSHRVSPGLPRLLPRSSFHGSPRLRLEAPERVTRGTRRRGSASAGTPLTGTLRAELKASESRDRAKAGRKHAENNGTDLVGARQSYRHV